MAQRSVSNLEGPQGLGNGRVDCPACKDGFDVRPGVRGQDQPCRLCNGRGYVIPEYLCVCGRPGFHEETGVGFHCGRAECVKESKLL